MLTRRCWNIINNLKSRSKSRWCMPDGAISVMLLFASIYNNHKYRFEVAPFSIHNKVCLPLGVINCLFQLWFICHFIVIIILCKRQWFFYVRFLFRHILDIFCTQTTHTAEMEHKTLHIIRNQTQHIKVYKTLMIFVILPDTYRKHTYIIYKYNLNQYNNSLKDRSIGNE